MAIYEYEVKVRLDRARTARAFDPEESLWIPELRRISKLLNDQLSVLSPWSSVTRPKDLPLLAIAIFGTYGSGKTSLLMTLHDQVNQRGGGPTQTSRTHTALSGAFKKIRKQVYSLPVIKPNLAARHDNFLYAFLATALAEVDRLQDKARDADARELRQPSSLLSPVHQAFHEVSEYLQVIDEPEEGKDHDPLGVSLERLERHASDIHLKQNLSKLIERLAAYFTRNEPSSLLLLPIDDADLASDTLINVLNTYRRYLEHPQLIPVFAFTGRMAEDLMIAHFADELKTSKGQAPPARRSAEAGYSFEEQIALQHLSKIFPVRNRIRLGPAPARVQAATFEISSRAHDQPREHQVLTLLEKASEILFGHAEWPVAPSVRLALRPSSLRRQIQILDAMYAANVGCHMDGNDGEPPSVRQHADDGEPSEAEDTGWVSVFDRAGWSLLNAHRDALREFNFYLDDLYGWTPRGLREVVLSTLLGLDLGVRRKLLRRWNYRTEDRRSQILSLLAVVVFRPRLPWEEASGDDPDEIRAGLQRRQENRVAVMPDSLTRGLPVEKGAIWFLNLWLGFYLPQILARNRTDLDDHGRPNVNRVRGVGWNLLGGPTQAIREALNNKEIFSTGMVLVDPKPVAEILAAKDGIRPEVRLLVRLWCYYGYERGVPWAAVSFWRGLSLIGILLSDEDLVAGCRKLNERSGQDGDAASAPDAAPGQEIDALRQRYRHRVRLLLVKHLTAARVPGSMNGLAHKRDQPALPFDRFDDASPAEDPQKDEKERMIDELVTAFVAWLGADRQDTGHGPILLLLPPTAEDRGEGESLGDRAERWRRCFLRRLHGDDLLGSFWPDLEATYLEKPANKDDDTVATVLTKWTRELIRYWSSHRDLGDEESASSERLAIAELLESCPILAPFAPAHRQRATFLGQSFKDPADNGAPGLNAISPVKFQDSPFAEAGPEKRPTAGKPPAEQDGEQIAEEQPPAPEAQQQGSP